MVYDITGKGDGSFNDSAYAGLSRAKEKLGVEEFQATSNPPAPVRPARRTWSCWPAKATAS